MPWSLYKDRGTYAKANRYNSLSTCDKLHSVSECRSASPLVLEGVPKKWRLADPMHFSQHWLKPLFRRINEMADSPSNAENEPRELPLIPSSPQKTLDCSQDCTTTSEVTFETSCIRTCLQSVPRPLEVRGTMAVTNSPLVPTRELPPSDTSLIPHCFAPKPCQPLTLPCVDRHASREKVRENQVHITNHTNSLQRFSRDESDGEKWPYGLRREMGSETYEDTMDDASGRGAVFSTTPKSNSPVSGNTGKRCQEDRFEGTGLCSLESNHDSYVSHQISYSTDGELLWGRRNTHSLCITSDTRSPLLPLARRLSSYNPGDRKEHAYVLHPLSSQASNNPLSYSKYSERDEDADIPGSRGGDRKGKGRSDNDTWHGEHDSGQMGDDDGDDKDNDNKDDGKESSKKVPKKTEVACHFCRRRKLKCDGGRPSCYQCSRRALACVYDNSVRRRGPGRKNKVGVRPAQRQRGQVQESEASTSISTLTDPSSSAFPDLPSPSYQAPTPLPGPPIPQYNFHLGHIPPTPPRLVTGLLPSSEDSSMARGQHRFHGHPLYSQPPYTRSSQPRDYAQQYGPEQYHQQLTTTQHSLQHSEQARMYEGEYSQPSTSGYSARIGNVVYHSENLTESQTSDHLAEEGDNEGSSRPRSKRRQVSSPPENSASSSSKRRYDYDSDEDDHIR